MHPLPTMTGRPRRAGMSCCSTEAKKASRSMCIMTGGCRGVGSAIEDHLIEDPDHVLGPEVDVKSVAGGLDAEMEAFVEAVAIGPLAVDSLDGIGPAPPNEQIGGDVATGVGGLNGDGFLDRFDLHGNLRVFSKFRRFRGVPTPQAGPMALRPALGGCLI